MEMDSTHFNRPLLKILAANVILFIIGCSNGGKSDPGASNSRSDTQKVSSSSESSLQASDQSSALILSSISPSASTSLSSSSSTASQATTLLISELTSNSNKEMNLYFVTDDEQVILTGDVDAYGNLRNPSRMYVRNKTVELVVDINRDGLPIMAYTSSEVLSFSNYRIYSGLVDIRYQKFEESPILLKDVSIAEQIYEMTSMRSNASGRNEVDSLLSDLFFAKAFADSHFADLPTCDEYEEAPIETPVTIQQREIKSLKKALLSISAGRKIVECVSAVALLNAVVIPTALLSGGVRCSRAIESIKTLINEGELELDVNSVRRCTINKKCAQVTEEFAFQLMENYERFLDRLAPYQEQLALVQREMDLQDMYDRGEEPEIQCNDPPRIISKYVRSPAAGEEIAGTVFIDLDILDDQLNLASVSYKVLEGASLVDSGLLYIREATAERVKTSWIGAFSLNKTGVYTLIIFAEDTGGLSAFYEVDFTYSYQEEVEPFWIGKVSVIESNVHTKPNENWADACKKFLSAMASGPNSSSMINLTMSSIDQGHSSVRMDLNAGGNANKDVMVCTGNEVEIINNGESIEFTYTARVSGEILNDNYATGEYHFKGAMLEDGSVEGTFKGYFSLNSIHFDEWDVGGSCSGTWKIEQFSGPNGFPACDTNNQYLTCDNATTNRNRGAGCNWVETPSNSF